MRRRAHTVALRRPAALAAAALAVAPLVPLATATASAETAAPSTAQAPRLDLGRGSLPETRRSAVVSPGVRVTSIVRGSGTASTATMGTTQNGPWRVNVAAIDPRTARGQLRTAVGTGVADTQTVATLSRWSRSTVAVNGSYFSQGRRTAPGDPVGLAVNGGTIISEPMRIAGHVGLLMESDTKKLTMGAFTWKASLTGRGRSVKVDAVNTVPKVPAACARLSDQRQCGEPGQVVRFTGHYGAPTPAGPGTEVVLDGRGCTVAVKTRRGGRLASGQTSFQATGSAVGALAAIAPSRTCPAYSARLFDAAGRQVPLTSRTYGVTGRYELLKGGRNVAPGYTTAFFKRHPRTIVGRTANGTVMLVTIDGRSNRSVGATLPEAARVARSLGMTDAVNLDGGGSTTMVVRGRVVNQPSGSARPVGDAVIYLG